MVIGSSAFVNKNSDRQMQTSGFPFKEQASSIVNGQETCHGLRRRMSGAPHSIAATTAAAVASAASAAAIVDASVEA